MSVQTAAPVVTQPDRIEWQPVGPFKVEGRHLYVGDSWRIGDDALLVPVTPGLYDIDVKVHYYGSDDRVACLRGRLQGSQSTGEMRAGKFSVDVASAGVIDARALDRWMDRDRPAYEAWQQGFSESGQSERAGFHPCPEIDASMVFTSTGFGDGSYTAMLLLDGQRPVGFELRFLDDAGYTNDPPQPLTWRQKGVMVLVAPIMFVLLLPILLMGMLVRALRKLSKARPFK